MKKLINSINNVNKIKLNRKWIFITTGFLLIIISVPLFYSIHNEKQEPDNFFFGTSFGLKTVEEGKLLIDEVKEYTNFFLINNWDVSTNETALNAICDYAADAGLTFIVFFDFIDVSSHGYPWHHHWVDEAKDKWGDKFGGIYIYEEPGGKQIDRGLYDEFHGERARMFENATTIDDAAEIFVNELPKGPSFQFLKDLNISKYVSDYALYWFDYLAGYDTVFAELGWNHSTAQHIGLCRGAAKSQNKDWGTIITWKNQLDDPTSIKTGSEMVEEMIVSFEAGANYIVVFNYPQYPENNPYGILTKDHFEKMKEFWEFASTHREDFGKKNGKVAFILPKNYGWGMRSVDDSLWGLWSADDRASLIWKNMNMLIEKYDIDLDIVYNDQHFDRSLYEQVIYWNSTN